MTVDNSTIQQKEDLYLTEDNRSNGSCIWPEPELDPEPELGFK
jgi:hypothetical protein